VATLIASSCRGVGREVALESFALIDEGAENLLVSSSLSVVMKPLVVSV
jgi:hypothetical protein